MRILMVSPYPPIRDGIASYAVQEVAALLDAGHEVEVLSPWPSAAHHHLALRGPRGPFALAKRVHLYDRVIVQYHPDIFYPLPLDERDRMLVTAGLLAAFGRKRNVEIRLHEMNFDWGHEPGTFGRMFRSLWRLPIAITVHTEHERQRMAESVGLPLDRIEVRDHGLTFVRRTAIDRNEARARLGIDPDAFVFLALGFVQPHKGFDRAVRAFDGLADHGCRLDIVGSVRVDEAVYLEYANGLRRLVDETPARTCTTPTSVTRCSTSGSIAADVLLLPYRYIWSSSVLQRAALYGTKVIATRVGGLDEQQHENVHLVDDDVQLAIAMHQAAGAPLRRTVAEAWPSSGSRPDRAAIQTAVQDRATVLGDDGRDLMAGFDPDSPPTLPGIPMLPLPKPSSRNPVAYFVKKVMRKLTAWEIDPIVHQLNAVHRAAVDERARGVTTAATHADTGDPTPTGGP